jgi:hypothetical protein
MIKTALFLILAVLFITSLPGQDCRYEVSKYFSRLDTSERPVYQFVDEMPGILNNDIFMKLLSSDSGLLKDIKCCPLRVWINFVVEPDSSLTNIVVCTKMEFCNDSIAINESRMFNNRIKDLLKSLRHHLVN